MSDEIKRGYYANGQLQYEHPYKDGKRHGTHRSWHKNGKLEYEWLYEHGKLVATDKEMKS